MGAELDLRAPVTTRGRQAHDLAAPASAAPRPGVGGATGPPGKTRRDLARALARDLATGRDPRRPDEHDEPASTGRGRRAPDEVGERRTSRRAPDKAGGGEAAQDLPRVRPAARERDVPPEVRLQPPRLHVPGADLHRADDVDPGLDEVGHHVQAWPARQIAVAGAPDRRGRRARSPWPARQIAVAAHRSLGCAPCHGLGVSREMACRARSRRSYHPQWTTRPAGPAWSNRAAPARSLRMPTIIPRWEWRTFGPGRRGRRAHLAALESTGVQESDETYLLSTAGPPRQGPRRPAGHQGVRRGRTRSGSSSGGPIMKAELPARRGRRGARVRRLRRLDAPARPREPTPWTQFLDELRAPAGSAAVAVHKRRVRYVDRRLHRRGDRRHRGRRPTRTIAIESEDGAAVIEAVRSVGLADYRQHQLRARASRALLDGVARALRRDRRRDELDQVPRRRACRRRRLARRRRPGRDHAPGRGARRDRRDRRRAGGDRTARRSPAWPTRRARSAPSRSSPSGRPACGSPATATRSSTRSASGRASASRSSRARRRAVSRTSPPRPASGLEEAPLAVFDTGGGSTQLTFGRGDARRRALQRERRRRPLHGAVRAGPAACRRRSWPRRWRPSPADLGRLDGRPPVDALVGMGGAVTNITAVKHGMTDVRSGRRPGHGPRPGGDRPPDRALPRRPTPSAAALDPGPPAQARRRDPRRGLRRPHRHGQAGPGRR